MKDLEKHLKEISMRQKESFGDKAKVEKAQKDNAKSILEFRDKIERFLRYCDIRIVSEEESKMETKIEKILRSVIEIQSKINNGRNNADVNRAIAEIRKEIGNKSDKVLSNDMKELLETFAKSSKTLHEELSQKIDKVQATVNYNQV